MGNSIEANGTGSRPAGEEGEARAHRLRRELRTFLTFATAGHQCQRLAVAHHYRYATLALLELGESEAFLLERLELLTSLYETGSRASDLRLLLHPHRIAFGAAAARVWAGLSWARRAMLAAFFQENDLPLDPVVPLVLAVDGEALRWQARGLYVETLCFMATPRATERVHQLLDRALQAAFLSDDAQRFVLHAGLNVPGGPTEDEGRRADACGIRFHRRRAGGGADVARPARLAAAS